MQKYSNTQTGMHWHYNKDGARHYRKYCEAGIRMPVAVALGGIPSITYSAAAPLPPDIPELVFASFLEGKSIETVKCETCDLLVPAESDFIIEGYIDPHDERTEGPFGDHTGFYSPQDMYPVFNVTCISARENAVYPSTVVGRPPMEDCFMAKATERIFLPVLKMIVPEICDINLPIEGVFHNCILVSIDKNYAGQAKKVIHALWGMGQMSSAKCIVIFDKDVNLRDSSHVLWKLYNNVDPIRDMIITQGSLDTLDHSAPSACYGGKIGIDATRKFKEEGMNRDWPDEIKMSQEIKTFVDRRWKEYGF
jgi:4-hydroxy-3-polyprenylbenzoate decarboxylase